MSEQIAVWKLDTHSAKDIAKAMKTAASASGVTGVTLLGANKDHLEVIGNGFDPVDLTKALRKKLGFANLIKVEQVRESATYSCYETERPKTIQYCATTSNYRHFQHPQIDYPMYYTEPTYDYSCSVPSTFHQYF